MSNKKPLAVVLGVTPDMAFSAGVVLQQLQRHLKTEHDVLLFHQGLGGRDAELLTSFSGCRLIEYDKNQDFVRKAAGHYKAVLLYRFEIFTLLKDYKTVIWLDSDICIQGDISGLAQYGPFSMALDQNTAALSKQPAHTLQTNFTKSVPGYDLGRDFYNAGVLVVQDSLSQAGQLYDWCLLTMERHLGMQTCPDQSALNLMLQKFPSIFQELPHAEYNCHPIWSAAYRANIIHCFGQPKFWNNGLLWLAYPAWRLDYEHWLELGGSAYSGQVVFGEFMNLSAFGLMYSQMNKIMDAPE